MKATIKFFIYMILILVVMYSSGCTGESRNVTADQAPVPKPASSNQTADNSQASINGGPEVPSGTAENNSMSNTTAAPIATGAATTTVVLYFANANGYLQAEQRSINKTPGVARQTSQELCLGPRTQGLFATIPGGTRLMDINIRDGLCTVNFSQELVTKHNGGSGSENATVYSIVNTLTQFRSIEQVQILVDGKVVESIAGHLDVSVPLTRDSNLIMAGVQLQ